MMAEGMENRYARHLAMRDRTLEWAESRGLTPFAPDGYRSHTVTCISNDKNYDIPKLNAFLRELGMIISNGLSIPYSPDSILRWSCAHSSKSSASPEASSPLYTSPSYARTACLASGIVWESFHC